jgi:UDP-N-acetylmuramyl pentapeptide phosphotransferase/UDP-N-acetylglucosamine-1-phosphate transferase
MKYFALIFFFFFVEILYFRIANFFHILDVPTVRGMHKIKTIRGGGVIYWVAVMTFMILYSCHYLYFFLGLTILSLISFWDDVKSVQSHYRLIVHFIAIIFLFIEIKFQYSWIYLLILMISVGILNAYNFMDGINGITGLYSIVNIISIAFVNLQLNFIYPEFLLIVGLSLVIFLFFNFRKQALCFGGDVGSISIAFILLLPLSKMILFYEWKYILFLIIYGLDTIYTIIYRIRLGANILSPHKLHFFQILVYEYHFSHLQVASFYSIIQLLINVWVFYMSTNTIIFYLPFLALVTIMHRLRKNKNLHFSSLIKG